MTESGEICTQCGKKMNVKDVCGFHGEPYCGKCNSCTKCRGE